MKIGGARNAGLYFNRDSVTVDSRCWSKLFLVKIR